MNYINNFKRFYLQWYDIKAFSFWGRKTAFYFKQTIQM